MSYRDTILARNPIGYWKLGSSDSENLGLFEPGVPINYTWTSEFNFNFPGIDNVDACLRLNTASYFSVGTCGLTPSALWKDFSMEFFVKLDYEYCKNIRIPIMWKDFSDSGEYSNQTGYGLAMYMTPTDQGVFLEVYMFDDTDSPVFYGYIDSKPDWEWYQFTLVTAQVDGGIRYFHRIYLDGTLIRYVDMPIKVGKSQFGDDHFWFNRTRANAGFTTGKWVGYVDEISIYDYALSEAEVGGTPRPYTPQVYAVTATTAELNDRIVIDGIHYDFTPSDWQDLGDDYKPLVETHAILDLDRVIVKHAKYEDNYGELNHRKLLRQMWTASWGSGATFMDHFMRDHLFNLYTLQRSFWLQYDDEMSRTCVILHNMADNYRVYYTPTFPIAPYGYDPKNNRNKRHRLNVFVNGAPTSAFKVDEESGAIIFDDTLTASDVVTMNYTWRARVRVKHFGLTPSNNLPNMYVGEVAFEQVEANALDDPWVITYPGTASYFYESGPSNQNCSVGGVNAPTAPYSANTPTLGADTDTSNSSDLSQNYTDVDVPGVYNTGWNTFKNYVNVKAYNSMPLIYETEWVIGKATNIAVFGDDEALRTDDGIVPDYLSVEDFNNTPDDTNYWNFESQFMVCYFGYGLDNVPSNAKIVGVEFEVVYKTSRFRLDYYEIPDVPFLEHDASEDIIVYTARDMTVVPVIDGRVQNNEAHNRANNQLLNYGVGVLHAPLFEAYSKETVVYGGATDLWNREWTVAELKGNFGFAIKTTMSVHNDFFQPTLTNSIINRHKTRIWAIRYKVHYKV